MSTRHQAPDLKGRTVPASAPLSPDALAARQQHLGELKDLRRAPSIAAAHSTGRGTRLATLRAHRAPPADR